MVAVWLPKLKPAPLKKGPAWAFLTSKVQNIRIFKQKNPHGKPE